MATAAGPLLAASPLPAAVTDPSGIIQWANASLRDLGSSAGMPDLEGRTLDDLVTGTIEPGLLALRPARRRFFRPVETPLTVPRGAPGETLHLLVECTEEVLAERRRKAREVHLSRAADDSMDAIVSLDAAGRIRYWNKGAERMFGYATDEVTGRPYDILVPQECRVDGELERIDEILKHQGVLRNFETVRLTRGGQRVEVDLTVTQLYEDTGTVAGRSVIYRDISLRRRLQAEVGEHLAGLEALKTELSRKVDELRAANLTLRRNQEKLIAMEKLSAIGEMAAKVAHEFRTPLVTIGGFSNTLWKSMPAEAPERQYLEIIREEVRRLERIVSEILEYVKPGQLETTPCDVNAMVDSALRPHGEQIERDGIDLVRIPGEGLPSVSVNRYQIHQVLTNLIVNAVQALESVPRETRRLTVATEPGENHVKISIGDTGPGIPQRHRERVFRAFFTTKPAGSGLGLAISSQIVAQHQATLTFDSEEGQGTTFHLRLPVQEPR